MQNRKKTFKNVFEKNLELEFSSSTAICLKWKDAFYNNRCCGIIGLSVVISAVCLRSFFR